MPIWLPRSSRSRRHRDADQFLAGELDRAAGDRQRLAAAGPSSRRPIPTCPSPTRRPGRRSRPAPTVIEKSVSAGCGPHPAIEDARPAPIPDPRYLGQPPDKPRATLRDATQRRCRSASPERPSTPPASGGSCRRRQRPRVARRRPHGGVIVFLDMRGSSVSLQPVAEHVDRQHRHVRKTPGIRMLCGSSWNTPRPSAMMLPQVGVSGGMPTPRKLRIASSRMAERADVGGLDDQRRNRVGQHVAVEDLRRGRAYRDGRLDIGLLPDRQHDRTDQPHHARNLRYRNRDDHRQQARARQRHQRDRQQDRRNRHQPVHEAHHDAVQPAVVAGHEADEQADRNRRRPPPGCPRSATRARRRRRG